MTHTKSQQKAKLKSGRRRLSRKVTFRVFATIVVLVVQVVFWLLRGVSELNAAISGSLFLFSSGLMLVWAFLGGCKKTKIGLRDSKAGRAMFVSFGLYWLLSIIGVGYSPLIVESSSWVAYNLVMIVLALVFGQLLAGLDTGEKGWVFVCGGGILFLVLVTISGYLTRQNATVTQFEDRNIFVQTLLLGLSIAACGLDRIPWSSQRLFQLLLYLAACIVVIFLGTLTGSRRTSLVYGPVVLLTPFLVMAITGRRAIRYLALLVSSISALGILLLVVSPEIRNGVASSFDSTIDLVLEDTLGLDELARRISIQGKLDQALSLIAGDVDISAREALWNAGTTVLGEYNYAEQWIGRGTRSFYAEPELNLHGRERSNSPHNFVLSALLEGGFVKALMIVIFSVAWISFVLRGVKRCALWESSFLLSSTFIWFVSVSISASEFFGNRMIYLILMCQIVLIQEASHALYRKKNKDKKNYVRC